MSTVFDITYIGHVCRDEVQPFGGEAYVQAGSAVLCGAMVAPRAGARTAVVTRMNPADDEIVAPLRALDVKVFIAPCPVTTYAKVVHPSENVDERRLYVTEDPGPFTMADVPAGLQSKIVHLAGISDHEFTLTFMRDLKAVGYTLSLDLQSFVRVIGPGREIVFSDVPAKREIVALLDFVKLDVVEAEILTGETDLGRAAHTLAEWGGKEVLITEKRGATLAVGGQLRYAPFNNRSQVGRTGRGDTTISAYLARRLTHEPADALCFAAALVSLKMETPGPFRGTIEEVEARITGLGC